MALCFPIGSERKLVKWLQENIEKLILLNKRRRWFHPSRVKLPLVECQQVRFGVYIFDLDLWFQVNSVEQPIKRNSVGSGHVSHCWTPSFDNHLDDSFVVFKKCTTESRLEKQMRWWVRNSHLTSAQPLAFSLLVMEWSPVPLNSPWASLTLQSQCPKGREQAAVHPYAVQHPSKWFQILQNCGISDVCFSHIQLMGTNVRLPSIHKTSPEVDFESSKSPAKSESWNKASRQCWAVLPTWQYSEFICVMNVWYQSCQSSVACLCPFGDCSCKFIGRPQSVWSHNSCQVQTCQYNLWANLW